MLGLANLEALATGAALEAVVPFDMTLQFILLPLERSLQLPLLLKDLLLPLASLDALRLVFDKAAHRDALLEALAQFLQCSRRRLTTSFARCSLMRTFSRHTSFSFCFFSRCRCCSEIISFCAAGERNAAEARSYVDYVLEVLALVREVPLVTVLVLPHALFAHLLVERAP